MTLCKNPREKRDQAGESLILVGQEEGWQSDFLWHGKSQQPGHGFAQKTSPEDEYETWAR
jgi:hypothetical protein